MKRIRRKSRQEEINFSKMEAAHIYDEIEGNGLEGAYEQIDNAERDTKFYLAIEAITSRDDDTLRYVLDSGLDVESHDDTGESLFQIAMHWDELYAAEILLQYGADIDTQGDFTWTPLMFAVDADNHSAVQFLLENGANTEIRNNSGETALLIAAYSSDSRTVRLLIEGRANIEARDNYSNTPLIVAAGNGRLSNVKALVEAGANKKAIGRFGTALEMAREDGHAQVASYLSGRSEDEERDLKRRRDEEDW